MTIFISRLLLLGAALLVFARGANLPLKTSGRWIVDTDGKRVKLACVNWSGAAQKDGVMGGLQFNTAKNISQLIHSYGFNCVRIPYSVQMVAENKRLSDSDSVGLLKANPELYGLRVLEILDRVVDALSNAGILIIFDNRKSCHYLAFTVSSTHLRSDSLFS